MEYKEYVLTMEKQLRWNVGEKEKNENGYNEKWEHGLEFRKRRET